MKLARKYTGRRRVIALEGGYHGMTLGSLAATWSPAHRRSFAPFLRDVTHVPFPDDVEESLARLRDELRGERGGGPAAAVLVEALQGEGGVRSVPDEWIRQASEIAAREGSLFIVDDVQVGCGRTGSFFSFEEAGVVPDIVCLSKALSGCGLPFAALLFRPVLDCWESGEHNGTFRGNNLAFTSGAVALSQWETTQEHILSLSALLARLLGDLTARYPDVCLPARGRGLIWGVPLREGARAEAIVLSAFEKGLLVESSGPPGDVVKLMPAFNSSESDVHRALSIIEDCLAAL